MPPRTDPSTHTEPARLVRLEYTIAARDLAWSACRRHRGAVIYIDARDQARCVPTRQFRPTPSDVSIGAVGCVRVCVDRTNLGWFLGHTMRLDAPAADADSTDGAGGTDRTGRMRLSARLVPLSREAGRSAGIDAIAEVLGGELSRLAGPTVSRSRARAHLRRALSDLFGVVSIDDLPMMAVRLARRRIATELSTQLPAGQRLPA